MDALSDSLTHLAPPGPAAWPDAEMLVEVPRLALAELIPEGARTLVIVPRLHDAVCGVGGMLSLLCRLGRPVVLVAVTHAAAGLQGARAWSADRRERAHAVAHADACRHLGLTTCMERHLGVPEGEARDHLARIDAAVSRLIRLGDVVLAPWRHDRAPDHEAVGQAVAGACQRAGATLLEMPLRMWQWSGPGDPRVPWSLLRSVVLPPAVQQRKAAALRSRHADEAGWLGPREFFFVPAEAAARPCGAPAA